MSQFDESNNYTQFEQPTPPVEPITPIENAHPKTIKEFLYALLKRTVVKIGLIVGAVAIAILVFVLFLPKQDPVQDDLIDYINNDMPTAIELEDNFIELYNIARENTASDYEMFLMIRDDVLPVGQKWAQTVEDIEVETDEVRALHELYIKLVNENCNAMTMILAALEKQDYALLTEANQKLDNARATGREFQSKLNSLMKEYDVVYE